MMKTTKRIAFVLCALLGLASCAQSPNQSSHEPQPRARSYSDAMDHVRGRGSVHAPSQIQIGSDELDSKAQQSQKSQHQEIIESREAREPLARRTLSGTLPCPPGDPTCQPLRASVTCAPAGMWRLPSHHPA